MHATQALGMKRCLLPSCIYAALPGCAGANLGEPESWILRLFCLSSAGLDVSVKLVVHVAVWVGWL